MEPRAVRRRTEPESRDTHRSAPANFEASNEKQLDGRALRFHRFADVAAEIERTEAWTHELTDQGAEESSNLAITRTAEKRRRGRKRGDEKEREEERKRERQEETRG